ncbi:CaiB/BaiF CoA transferase family protein [Aurantimonas endophytica]|uniref:Crotonobetainyl-CoA:carnitine CoA-transferase CaiB-like acyl-CoA transferase n=1 Tax=Aurantimonas endophytica TaxID=1522175 RepID=A0A7W6HBN8_9HYPH|nr:CoA transferase [Aurantimonas endophytica]MBB4002198.1 crotonobetainyl-CoA:carnitine CoA-transferase CaiB-like acyl-CoA transferase [Aurantimonas endophytica]MCO6402173.1 CoA transferase [Aurantimonas endophytica]
MAAAKGPLEGMKVVELAHIMAGPVCGMMLADMGADVIKVEKPEGDDTRRFLPPDINGESAAYMMMNRNKRGIVLDLKSEDGKAVLRRMLETADVVIENYRMGTMEKLGLGYEKLREANPGLIYCEISGFGRTGPYAGRGGFDLIAQGMSGLMSITGEGAGRPPVKSGAPVTDITAGILGALGCAAAYARKLQTGEGQKVDTSLFEAGITHTYWQSAIAFATGVAPGPLGSAHPLNAPYQAFRTEDGWINLGAANQKNWERMLAVIGAEELASDPRFANNHDRMQNLPALAAILDDHFSTRTSAEWLERLEAAGVPAGPVLDVGEMHRDPQTLHREMVVETTHPTAGPVKAIGLPIKFSETPGGVIRPAPLLGQHSREVLAEYGWDDDAVDAFLASGAVRESAAGR